MNSTLAVTSRRRTASGPRLFWRLVRNDRSTRGWLWWGLAGVVMGLIMLAPGFSHCSPPLQFMFWSWSVLMLVSVRASVRCHPLALALPVSPRLLWTSRLVSTALLILAVILPAALTVAAGRLLGSDQATLRALDASLWLHLGAGYVLALALVQSPAPTLQELPQGWLAPVYALVLAGGLFQQPAMTHHGSRWIAAILIGVAVALCVNTWRRLPQALLLLPTQPGDPTLVPYQDHPARCDQRWPAARPRGSWAATRSALGIAYWHWFSLLGFPLLFFFGAWRSGYLAGGLHGPALTVMTLGMLFAFFRISLIQIVPLDPLPITRRRLFATSTLPGALVLAGGIVVGEVVDKGLSNVTLVEYGSKRCDPRLDVRVPFEFWDIDWRGNAPPNAHGDKHIPCAASRTGVFHGGAVVLYSPFHVAPGSPPEVAARQLSRAVSAVFGAEIPPEELQERYFSAAPDGTAVLREGPFRLQEDYPGLKPSSWIRTLPAHVAILGSVWFLWLAVVMPVFSGWAPGIQRFRQVAAFSILFLVMLMPIILSIVGVTSEWKVSAFSAILLRKLAEGASLPTSLLWLVSLAVVATAYRLARARFEALELIPLRGEKW